MATFTQSQGALGSALITMGTLADDTYASSSAIDLGASIPLDVTIQLEATPSATPTGNKQVLLFAVLSLNNVSYGSGPISGTDATDELDLHFIGSLPCATAAEHRKFFSLAGLPIARYLKLVVKNDTGVALTSGFVYKADITGSSA